MRRCADDDTGMYSVKPWMRPRKAAYHSAIADRTLALIMMRLVLALATVVLGCAHGESHGPTKIASAQTRAHAGAVEVAPSLPECDSLFLHAIDVIATPEVTGADKDQAIAALH